MLYLKNLCSSIGYRYVFAGVSVDLNNPCVGSFFLSNLPKNCWFLEKIDSNIDYFFWFAVRWRMQSYWLAFTKSTCPCTKTWMRSRKFLPKIVEMNLQPWRKKSYQTETKSAENYRNSGVRNRFLTLIQTFENIIWLISWHHQHVMFASMTTG